MFRLWLSLACGSVLDWNLGRLLQKMCPDSLAKLQEGEGRFAICSKMETRAHDKSGHGKKNQSEKMRLDTLRMGSFCNGEKRDGMIIMDGTRRSLRLDVKILKGAA